VPPQVASVSRKPLSIALEEIAASKIVYDFPEGDEGTDFNDMAKAYSLNAVRDLIVDGVLPSGEKVERDVFGLLDLDELEAPSFKNFLVLIESATGGQVR